MARVHEVDVKNAAEEESPLNDVELQFLQDALAYDGVDPDMLTETDRIQIIRGYQTYDPRGQCTNEAFKNICQFRKEYAAHEFLRMRQERTEEYNTKGWCEWIYPPDKYGHIIIAMKYMDLDVNYLESLTDREITRLQAQRLAAYSAYKAKLSHETGVQRYKHTYIVDLHGSGMGILSGRKKKMVQRVMAIGSDNYPETVWKIYVINAPWVFRAAWGVAKAWVHPVTQAKINVLGKPSECAKRLEIEGVKRKNIPAIVEGPCEGKTSFELINEMTAYTLAMDRRKSAVDGTGGDVSFRESFINTSAASSPSRSPVKGGRRTPQTTML